MRKLIKEYIKGVFATVGILVLSAAVGVGFTFGAGIGIGLFTAITGQSFITMKTTTTVTYPLTPSN